MKDFNSVKILKNRILEFYRSQAFFKLLFKVVAVFQLFRFFYFYRALLDISFSAEAVTLVK